MYCLVDEVTRKTFHCTEARGITTQFVKAQQKRDTVPLLKLYEGKDYAIWPSPPVFSSLKFSKLSSYLTVLKSIGGEDFDVDEKLVYTKTL